MKEKFTTYYLNYNYQTFTGVLLLLSFGLFNIVIAREVYAFSWTQVVLWTVFVLVFLFLIKRQRILVNNGRMFMQGTFITQDLDIDLKKISKVKATGKLVEFKYKNSDYKIFTTPKLKKLLLNVRK